MGSIRINFWRTGSLVAFGVASSLAFTDGVSAQRGDGDAGATAAVYRTTSRDQMPTDHFAAQHGNGDESMRSVLVQSASYSQPQLQLQRETRNDNSRYQRVPLNPATAASRYSTLPKYRTMQPPGGGRYAKTQSRFVSVPLNSYRRRGTQDDPFGEDQVDNVPDARSKDDAPFVFPRDRASQTPLGSGQLGGQKNNGVVLPPKFLSPPRESSGQGRPRVPGGGGSMPDLSPDQRMPRPGEPDRGMLDRQEAERRERALRAQAARRERERTAVPDLDDRPERGFSDGADDRRRRRRSRDQSWGNDEIEYSSQDFNIRQFDRVPSDEWSQSHGPDSWYRNGSGVGNGLAQPYGLAQPHGFSNGDIYDSVVAPTHGPPVVSTSPQMADQNGMYHPAVMNAATGGCYGGQTGASTCGTGVINGCYDSVFYLSLFGGYVDLDPIRMNDAAGQSRFDVDDGFMLGGALGQYQGQNLRTEIEFSYRDNDLTQLTVDGNPAFASALIDGGQVRSFSGMANAIWEFNQLGTQRIKPYVGAGFGFANVQTEASIGTDSIINPTADSDSSFAYQWMAGVNYRASLGVDVFVEYRYLKADSLQLDTVGISDATPNGSGGFDYETQNVFGGIRFKF